MKKSKISIIVGLVLILLGICLIVSAMMPAEHFEEFTIPSGDRHHVFETSTIVGLRVEGSFEVWNFLETLTMYVFTPAQYDAYTATGATESEFSMTANSGDFDVELSTMKAFIVFEHGPLWRLFGQGVTLEYTVHGTNLTFLIGGILLAVAGVVVMVYGTRLGKKETAMAPPQQQPPADVMMFDQQKPPGNP